MGFATSTPAFPVVFLFLHQISFPLQNPGTQTAHILSLTMVELAEKLKEGSLSPESVLYSYIGKVSDVSNMERCSRAPLVLLATSLFCGRMAMHEITICQDG